MQTLKRFFKNTGTRVWFAVTTTLIILVIVVAVLATTTFNVLFCTLFGNEEIVGRDGSVKYYESEATSKKDAYERGNAVSEELCEEGFVLLKNSDQALPLAKNAKISVFGKNSVNLAYGGSGSGGAKTKGATTLYDSLEQAGFQYNQTLKAFYENDSASGKGRDANPAMENGGVTFLDTGETPYASYSGDIISSYSRFNDAALIVISRIGGEGWDLPRYSQESHYLQFTDNEKTLIDEVTKAFDKVILVLNTQNVMEVGDWENNDKISAIIHMAGPGYVGVSALGRILSGEVNPSAHTVDTWARDFRSNPTWNNFGNNFVSRNTGTNTPAGNEYVSNGEMQKSFFVDYEEGVYVGYRYYETRGFTDGAEWYRSNVVYPFGYGLSYTDFSWEIADEDISDVTLNDGNKNKDFTVRIKVTNTGNAAGKDVVQLYATAPYIENEIEKPYVVLCGFAKTGLIQPNASETVEITFNPYDIASYDDSDANHNGFRGYELDAGEYALKLQSDANTVKVDLQGNPFNLAFHAENVTWENDPVTGTAVVNRFEDADDEIEGHILSRSDWEGTWPTLKNTREFAEGIVTKKMIDDRATNNPNEYTSVPATGAPATKKLVELRGLSYNDPAWNELLDSLTFNEMKDLFNKGAFGTGSIGSIGKPATLEADGPVGFVNFMSDVDIYGTVSYACEAVMGSTWNTELVQRMGSAVGDEGIFGKISLRAQTPYSGWYAPGVNIHRSPFGGRNYEYFSEDGFLTGMLAAAEISGANSKGVYTFMKHFALNEQETDRDSNGLLTWATEQSMREIYLKPFEIAVKKGHSHGIMTSFNRLGTKWTGGDYRLVTEVLRNEWGFTGAVICDFNVSSYMNAKQMVYAGGDINLTTTRPWVNANAESAADVSVLRNAAHNTLYTVVNSCAMNGITKDTVLHSVMPMWEIVMIVVMCAIVIGCGVWGFFAVRKFVKNGNRQEFLEAQFTERKD